MKSILIATAIGLLLISCKKGSTGEEKQKQTLLTEVSIDGLTNLRFIYNSDNLLSKIDSYKADPADNSVASYVTFQYDDKGQIAFFTAYSLPGNVGMSKITVQYDGDGKFVSTTTYDLQGASPNTPYSTTAYSYNAKGQVNKIVEKNKDGEVTLQSNLFYYDNGHIKEIQRWKNSGGILWMAGKDSYSSSNGTYPHGMEQLQVLLGSDFIAKMYSDAISHLSYSQIGAITKQWNEQMSAREFNEDATLKKQVLTAKYIKPLSDDKVYVVEYKYTKQ
ncbi:MAG TPA: hypothetical protein VD996_09125 [Chitinophagaceae bacterium]|nr:hypothetical protein [Chitinophagaceae bacterium]